MITAERLVAALRANMPATLQCDGLFVNEVGLAWLLSRNGKPKSRRRMRELREAGELPPGAPIAGAWTYDLEDVAAWWEQQKVDAMRRDAAESGGFDLGGEQRKRVNAVCRTEVLDDERATGIGPTAQGAEF